MEVYADEIIDDGEDSEGEGARAEYRQVTEKEEKKGGKSKGEKPAFWDKESNEKTAKKINEEDDYKWEDEVRKSKVTSTSHIDSDMDQSHRLRHVRYDGISVLLSYNI